LPDFVAAHLVLVKKSAFTSVDTWASSVRPFCGSAAEIVPLLLQFSAKYCLQTASFLLCLFLFSPHTFVALHFGDSGQDQVEDQQIDCKNHPRIEEECERSRASIAPCIASKDNPNNAHE